MAGPVLPSSDGRAKTALLFGGGLVATIVAVVALVALWPSGGGGDVAVTDDVPSPTRSPLATDGDDGSGGEPSERTTTTEAADDTPIDLFESRADEALAEMSAATGARQAVEIAIYPEYAFLAYRDRVQPDHLDRRSWRHGRDQGDGDANPIDDRVNADTEPRLFAIRSVDLTLLPGLVDDAASRFGIEVDVTHVIIDRFLPFDERVLIRVYASPSDGRSGGGYVQYTLAGTYVKTVG